MWGDPGGSSPEQKGSWRSGQGCRTQVDLAIVTKVCELTCGRFYRELSVLQLNELVANSGKAKIKTGQVQAVLRSWEPDFQSTGKKKTPSCVCKGHF